MTMYDPRTNLSQQVVAEVKKYFQSKVYQTMTAQCSFGRSSQLWATIMIYDPNCSGAKAYMSLAQEVIDGNGGDSDGQ